VAWKYPKVRTAGIDLAAQAANTGVCVVDWERRAVDLLAVNDAGDPDGELVGLICGPGVVRTGIDTPLGWPDRFVDAVVAHHTGRGWPAGDDGSRRGFRLRHTDEVVAATTGRHPMSVSADRIAVAAMRGADLQRRVVERLGARAVDRSGVTGRVAEVYPAAALGCWGLPASGYKGGGDAARTARRHLLAGVVKRCGVTLTPQQRALALGSDHVLDALVCAVVARAVVDGGTASPDRGTRTRARREGWIHVPYPDWSPGPG